MPTIRITREQFRPDGELAVLHVPTGQRFYTHAYEQAEQMSEVIGSNLRNEMDAAGNDYDPEDLSRLAFDLLRERLAAILRNTAT